jgi:hypothetical protein
LSALAGLLLAGLLPTTARAEVSDEDSGVAAIAAPLVAYDSNLLLGVGAFGQVVWEDPTGQDPFRASVGAQIYFTTGGFQDHSIRWDLPSAFGSKLRWDARLRMLTWSRAPYFGIGAGTTRLPAEQVGDTFYLWNSERYSLRTNLRRPVADTPWDAYGTLIVAIQEVGVYPTSLLREEQPEGIEGGILNVLGVGGFRDTRTNEIDPYDGSVVDLQLRASGPWLGSSSQWWGAHASWRGWWSPKDGLVFASRAMVDGMFGDPPFYQQAYMGGLQRGSFGGRFFLRGLVEERLRVDGVAGVQGELRWRFARATVLKTVDLGFQLVPFVDTAQAWTLDGETELDPWLTTGAGLRINIKELLILRADGGVAWERYAVGDPERPQFQIYILAEHPF